MRGSAVWRSFASPTNDCAAVSGRPARRAMCVRRLGVEVVVRQVRRIYPRVGDQLALQPVEDHQVRLAVEDRQELILAIADRGSSRSRRAACR